MPKIFSDQDRQVIRDRLLAIGLTLLETQSCGSIAIDQVAELAGIAKGTFYHFFPSKNQYFYAIAQSLMEEDRKKLERLFAAGPVGKEGVRAYLQDYYLQSRNLYDYFTVADLRRLMRTFPTEGDKPESLDFARELLSREQLDPGCRPEVAINLLNVLAMTAKELRTLQVGGKEETLQVLIDTVCTYHVWGIRRKIMILFWECVFACCLFAGIFVVSTLHDPLAFFREYSPAVQEQYRKLHPEFQPPEKQMTPGLIAAKLITCLFFTAILAAMARFAGADSFLKGFGCSYLIWTVVNVFDATVLDLGVFMFWKKVRLPGTEDMDQAYRQNVWPSMKGGLYGILIGIPVCLLCGWIVTWF